MFGVSMFHRRKAITRGSEMCWPLADGKGVHFSLRPHPSAPERSRVAWSGREVRAEPCVQASRPPPLLPLLLRGKQVFPLRRDGASRSPVPGEQHGRLVRQLPPWKQHPSGGCVHQRCSLCGFHSPPSAWSLPTSPVVRTVCRRYCPEGSLLG